MEVQDEPKMHLEDGLTTHPQEAMGRPPRCTPSASLCLQIWGYYQMGPSAKLRMYLPPGSHWSLLHPTRLCHFPSRSFYFHPHFLTTPILSLFPIPRLAPQRPTLRRTSLLPRSLPPSPLDYRRALYPNPRLFWHFHWPWMMRPLVEMMLPICSHRLVTW